jgi:predicted dehydrogenase
MKMISAGFGFRIGDPRQWRLKKELAGGGALMDVGIYALHACRYLTGQEPETVSAQEAKTDPQKFAEVDESIVWTMAFPQGVIANCATSYNCRGLNHFTAYCEGGSFGLDPAYSYSGLRGQSSSGRITFPQIDQFAEEIDDFSLSIKEGKPLNAPGVEGLRDLVAIEAIYESIRSGLPVKLTG